jgi:hypothetical protein
MRIKTFKIGEESKDPTIRIQASGTHATYTAFDYLGVIKYVKTFSHCGLRNYLYNEITTPYHTDKIMQWIHKGKDISPIGMFF